VQLDASYFDWLEGRGPAMTLHGAIDDATGTAVALYFRPTEDLHGYTMLLWHLAISYGLPGALYGDRLNVFVRNDRHWSLPEQLQGEREPTHYGRMLRALGIGYIAAGSPQAKGRIERLWRTLQDRLTVELRLRDIRTLEAANAALPQFLADYNRRFTRPPADTIAAWRPAPRHLLAELSCRYQRIVGRDNTLRLVGRIVQLPRSPGRTLVGCRVEVRECIDGRLLVLHTGRAVLVQRSTDPEFVLAPRESANADRAKRLRASRSRAAQGGRYLPMAQNASLAAPKTRISKPAPTRRGPQRPASSHPWRHAAPLSRRGRRRTLTSAQG
jgi:Integrase core domain